MPEAESIEKQITGQMNIEDILAEWERKKKENLEKREEEVRQHVLQQTGAMFTEFEQAVRDGLLEKLEKEKAADTADTVAEDTTDTDEVEELEEITEEPATEEPVEELTEAAPAEEAEQEPVEELPEEDTVEELAEEPAYEPEAEESLDLLIPKYINSIVYGAFIEAVASENGASIQEMDAATSNAEEMISTLSLAYNRARQGAITQELTEIISGAEALN